EIAEQQAVLAADDPERAGFRMQAREHRRLAREARRNYAGTRHALRQHTPLILAICLVASDPTQQGTLDTILGPYSHESWNRLVAAVHRIVADERDADVLCEDLGPDPSMIVEAILAGLADPSTLSDLMSPDSQGD